MLTRFELVFQGAKVAHFSTVKFLKMLFYFAIKKHLLEYLTIHLLHKIPISGVDLRFLQGQISWHLSHFPTFDICTFGGITFGAGLEGAL